MIAPALRKKTALSAAVPAADVARMSWPSRSKRSVVRTMSSCTGAPTVWAIKANQNSRLRR
jgi:hypothetical protein